MLLNLTSVHNRHTIIYYLVNVSVKGMTATIQLISASCGFRAEPLLARIKADRTVVLSPVFDRVEFDTLEVTSYFANAHAFDWQLWCMYESFRKDWYELNDPTVPGK